MHPSSLKGTSGVDVAVFVTLAATLSVVKPALVPGMAIVCSTDEFMREPRAPTNITGNGTAAVFVSWREDERDHDLLQRRLNQQIDPSDVETAVTWLERPPVVTARNDRHTPYEKRPAIWPGVLH